MSFNQSSKSNKFNRKRHFSKKSNRGFNPNVFQPPSGFIPNGASNRDHTSATVSEHLLEGFSNEEFNAWHDEFLNAELNKAGLQDYYRRPGAPGKPRPTAANFAANNATSAQAKAQEKRAMEQAQSEWDDKRAKTFQLIVDKIQKGSNAYNIVSDIIKKDIKGSKLDEMMQELKNYFNSRTQAGLFDVLFSIMNLPNTIDDAKKHDLAYLVPHVYSQFSRLDDFVITAADPATGDPAVTCKLPEPIVVILSFIMPLLMGNTEIILEFFNREFRQKDRVFQTDLTKLSWAEIFPLFKGYLQSALQESSILAAQPAPAVSMAAHSATFSPAKGSGAGGSGKGQNKQKSGGNKDQKYGGKTCMFHGTNVSHTTEECDRIKEMVAGSKLPSGAQLPGKPSPKKPGNSNQYHSPAGKKGKFAHENSYYSRPDHSHPRTDNSSAMLTESDRAIYQQDEDGNFVRISANSSLSSVPSAPGFHPRYLPIESAWALGTQFTTTCDEDGFSVDWIPPVPAHDGVSMPACTGTDYQSRPSFCDEDGNPLESMPVVNINMINISGGGGQANEDEARPVLRQRLSLEDDQAIVIPGDIPIPVVNDPACINIEKERMLCYRSYRERDFANLRRNWGNALASVYARQMWVPPAFHRDNIRGVNMVRGGMTIEEVEEYRESELSQHSPRIPVVNDPPADVSDGEDDDSQLEVEDEEMPDLAPLPVELLPPQRDDMDDNERPRPHFRYRPFSKYPPIASHVYVEEEVINPEVLPANFHITAKSEDLVRADFAVCMHTLGHNPPPGNEVYQINQMARARLRTEELYLNAFREEYGMINRHYDTNLTESDKYVLRKGFWHMACTRAWQEAACSGPNHNLERQCNEQYERIVSENNMDSYGKYWDDRSEGTAACPREKDAATGFNILRLSNNLDPNLFPVLNVSANDEPRIDYLKSFPLDSQRGLSSYIETAGRTPEHRLRSSIMAMGTDCIEKQEALDRYAVYADSCASNSVIGHKEMLIPNTFVPCQGQITGSTTTNPIAIIGRGLLCFMGRRIGVFVAPGITKNLISEGRLCTHYSFRVAKEGSDMVITDLLSPNHSNTAIFSIHKPSGLYRIPEDLLM